MRESDDQRPGTNAPTREHELPEQGWFVAKHAADLQESLDREEF